MAQNFLEASLDQAFLLPVDMRDWLPRDHFAYFVIELVDQLDLSGLLGTYRSDGRGGAAHHPRSMVRLLVYAYCDGERSSRRIEERCRTDVGYRLMTGALVPDHATIARFRDRHEQALAKLFVPVLAVCLQAGMGELSLVAIDGSKFRCPASLRANRTAAQIEAALAAVTAEIEAELARIAAELLASTKRADLDEQDLFGATRQPGTLPRLVGLPKKLHGRARRRARLAEAKRRLDAAHQARLEAYRHKLAQRAAKEAEQGRKLRGRKPKPPQRDPDEKINVTDPDSRIMKDPHGGYLQGYNGQAAVARDRVHLVDVLTNDQNDTAQLIPVLEAAQHNIAVAGSTRTIGQVLADAGYCTTDALAALGPQHPPVLLSTGKERTTRTQQATHAGDPPPGLSPKEQMRWRLGTPDGKAAYAQRGCTVEPAFGQHKHNRRLPDLPRLGETAAKSEWSLLNTTDNITKLFRRIRDGKATAAWSTLARIIAAAPFPTPAAAT